MPAIVLIDDDPDVLRGLGMQVGEALRDGEATIREWQPNADGPPLEELARIIGDDTALVVTDYDLSKTKSGILGDSVVRWCQRNIIPAALYTRGDHADMPSIPDLFELKLTRNESAGHYIAQLYRGFVATDRAVSTIIRDEALRSPASVLAHVVGEPNLEFEFAQYAVRLGDSSGALTTRVRRTAPADAHPPVPDKAEVRRVLSYVLGHLMVNAVIRYPGPMLPIAALCAYIGTTLNEAEVLNDLFADARYDGPFGSLDRIYWRTKVDAVLEGLIPPDVESDPNIIRRRAVEAAVERTLDRHGCPRCGGVNGGFFCPFTAHAVCERGDCSTASNSWLPPGATACRIELDFFDEWAPLLGF
jgi:hypothetical protein